MLKLSILRFVSSIAVCAIVPMGITHAHYGATNMPSSSGSEDPLDENDSSMGGMMMEHHKEIMNMSPEEMKQHHQMMMEYHQDMMNMGPEKMKQHHQMMMDKHKSMMDMNPEEMQRHHEMMMEQHMGMMNMNPEQMREHHQMMMNADD